MKTRLDLLLCVVGISAHAQSPGMFTATGNMTTARSFHTATLLSDGKVLIAGGTPGSNPAALCNKLAGCMATAELYDPDSGTFAPTSDMTTSRSGHTATLLPDGRVLIAGGTSSQAFIPGNSAEIYDPSTGTFAVTGNMIFGRVCQQANLLGNGTVLIVGGSGATGQVPSAEIYDPATATFTATGAYASDTSGFNTCQGGVSTLLPNGKVLIVWETSAAELYDPNTGLFTSTAMSIGPCYCDGMPTATLLSTGKVLVAGGEDDAGIHTNTELYDSSVGTFTSAGNMTMGRVAQTATLLPDGTVLLAGGQADSCPLSGRYCTVASAELYQPSTGTFSATGSMTTPRDWQTATLLKDGRVLFAGGEAYGGGIFYGPFSTAEIYTPAVLVPAPALFSLSGDGQGQGAIWNSQTGQIPSAANPATAGDVLAMYTTSLFEGGVIPPQVSVGGKLAEILFFGDAPGYPGYFQMNFRVPAGVAPGSAVPVRLTYIGRPSNAVTIGVQ
jgi:hypothetical protein